MVVYFEISVSLSVTVFIVLPAVLKASVQFCVAHCTSRNEDDDVTCLQFGIVPVKHGKKK